MGCISVPSLSLNIDTYIHMMYIWLYINHKIYTNLSKPI